MKKKKGFKNEMMAWAYPIYLHTWNWHKYANVGKLNTDVKIVGLKE